MVNFDLIGNNSDKEVDFSSDKTAVAATLTKGHNIKKGSVLA